MKVNSFVKYSEAVYRHMQMKSGGMSYLQKFNFASLKTQDSQNSL